MPAPSVAPFSAATGPAATAASAPARATRRRDTRVPDLAAELRRAVERQEFVVEYQPVVELRGGAVVGAEALVRWRHPVRGTIPPSEFLALAEETGDIIPIGDWVIARSCRLARSWQMVGGHGAVNMVSVNLSTRQLENGAIEQTVADALSESRLDPSALVLEISAGDAVPSDLIIDRLHAFHEMGARLALDDFGRGASLLAARMLPFDIVKLDRQMTSDVVGPQSDRVFAEALLSIGRARNLETVAKGVETREQARHLQAMGCDLAQGYLYSKPLGSEGISALLARARR